MVGGVEGWKEEGGGGGGGGRGGGGGKLLKFDKIKLW